jgi:hypothetical protein
VSVLQIKGGRFACGAGQGRIGADGGNEARFLRGAEQVRDDVDGSRCVEHVHHGLAELGGDLDRGVLTARRGPTNEQGNREASTRHFARDEHHLVERGRDQTAQADEVGLLVDGRLQDAVHGDHDPQIHDRVVVAAENDAHDVLPDIVHVALHRGEDDLAR